MHLQYVFVERMRKNMLIQQVHGLVKACLGPNCRDSTLSGTAPGINMFFNIQRILKTSYCGSIYVILTILTIKSAQFSHIKYSHAVVQPSLPPICRASSSFQTETLSLAHTAPSPLHCLSLPPGLDPMLQRDTCPTRTLYTPALLLWQYQPGKIPSWLNQALHLHCACN